MRTDDSVSILTHAAGRFPVSTRLPKTIAPLSSFNSTPGMLDRPGGHCGLQILIPSPWPATARLYQHDAAACADNSTSLRRCNAGAMMPRGDARGKAAGRT